MVPMRKQRHLYSSKNGSDMCPSANIRVGKRVTMQHRKPPWKASVVVFFISWDMYTPHSGLDGPYMESW